MNLIIQVQDREAVPVRALALLTNWRFMSPDIVAHVIGGTGGSNASLFGDLESHRVENGQVQPINKDWWVQFPLKELQALSKKIKETESIDEVGYSEWRKLSLKELPAGVFVWKDDYQKLHDKNWNDRFRQTYCAFRDWNAKDKMDDPNEAVEAQVQRQLTREELADDHPLRRHLKESLQVLKRWEKPDYSPFIAPEMCAVVMEGFEPLLPTPVIAPASVAEHDDVDALFERIKEVERALNYWETRDDSKASDAEIKERKLNVFSTEKAALIEKKRLMRGDFTESYQAPQTTTPSPAPVVAVSASGAVESDKAGPVVRGWVMKKNALIAKHTHQWETIKRDFQDASENGLSDAAKAPEHGNWFESAALNWARQRGKLTEDTQQGPATLSTVWTGKTHTIRD